MHTRRRRTLKNAFRRLLRCSETKVLTEGQDKGQRRFFTGAVLHIRALFNDDLYNASREISPLNLPEVLAKETQRQIGRQTLPVSHDQSSVEREDLSLDAV